MKLKSFFFALMVQVGMHAQVPTAGLMAGWTFNGNANDIGNAANNGTVYGATLTKDRCGIQNAAYYFDGINDYIQMPNYGPLGANPRSVSLWILSNNTATNPLIIFDYGDSNGSAGDFGIVHNYNCQGIGIDISNEAFIKGNSCVNNGAWHHIVVTFDPTVNAAYGSTALYVDGILQQQISCSVTGTNSSINTVTLVPIQIGKNVYDYGRFFKGSIDDIYVYNRAISPTEVLQLFRTCSLPILGNNPICPNSTNVYSIQPVLGVSNGYSWIIPNGWNGNSITNTISVQSNTFIGNIQVNVSTGCGNSMTSTLAVQFKDCTKTGVDEAVEDVSFRIYPNPSSGEFTLELEANSELKIYNSLGQLVKMGNYQMGQHKLSVEKWNNGVYLVYVTNNKGVRTVKLIKN